MERHKAGISAFGPQAQVAPSPSPTAYSFAVFGRRVGPWRASQADARADAEAAGFGFRDGPGSIVYLDCCADIISTRDPAVMPASRAPQSNERAGPSRIERIIARRERCGMT
jgi:hypothetical protein